MTIRIWVKVIRVKGKDKNVLETENQDLALASHIQDRKRRKRQMISFSVWMTFIGMEKEEAYGFRDGSEKYDQNCKHVPQIIMNNSNSDIQKRA